MIFHSKCAVHTQKQLLANYMRPGSRERGTRLAWECKSPKRRTLFLHFGGVLQDAVHPLLPQVSEPQRWMPAGRGRVPPEDGSGRGGKGRAQTRRQGAGQGSHPFGLRVLRLLATERGM